MAERLRDKGGDVWERQLDGRLNLVVTRQYGAEGLVLPQREVEDEYGPLVALVPAAAPDSANLTDFVRELRELCDRWASKLGA